MVQNREPNYQWVGKELMVNFLSVKFHSPSTHNGIWKDVLAFRLLAFSSIREEEEEGAGIGPDMELNRMGSFQIILRYFFSN